jgi:hypothetical protein
MLKDIFENLSIEQPETIEKNTKTRAIRSKKTGR